MFASTMQISKFLIVIYINVATCFFDPYTIVSVGTAATSYLVDHSYCRWTECCNSKGIPANFTRLQEELGEYLYGQHLVKENILHALKSHWDSKIPPKKALTMSFHGWTGGGKNYVATFIKNALFEKGSSSNFVHQYNGRLDFPSADEVNIYKSKLFKEIKAKVQKCDKQLFVFDEVDKMPPGVLDVIKPLIDYNVHVDRVDFRNTIFIFLSNSGGELITNHLLTLWKDGVQRDDIELKHFEKLILTGAFNEEGWLYGDGLVNAIVRDVIFHFNILQWYNSITTVGGLFRSDNIKSNLIDLYIPFLPMEHEHVRLCILDEFKRRGVSTPKENFIDEVMETVEFDQIFAKTGCKRISQRVGLIVQKYRLR